jgi:hypothetical protein
MLSELGRRGYQGDVLEYARSLVHGAYEHLTGYLTDTTSELETQPNLGLVVVRDLFTVDFVAELVEEAQQAGFKQTRDDPDRSQATIPLDSPSDAVQGFASALRHADPTGIVSLYSNRYIPSREGGKMHVDTGSSTPVAMVGSGEGLTRVARSLRCSPIAAISSRKRVSMINGDPRVAEDVYFGGGDLVVFDGRERPHQGRATSLRGEPRITVVGYSLKFHQNYQG